MIILTKEQAEKISELLSEYSSALNNMYCHYDHYSKNELDEKTSGIGSMIYALETQDQDWFKEKLVRNK